MLFDRKCLFDRVKKWTQHATHFQIICLVHNGEILQATTAPINFRESCCPSARVGSYVAEHGQKIVFISIIAQAAYKVIFGLYQCLLLCSIVNIIAADWH